MAPFVFEQGKALQKLGVELDYLLISNGLKGYLKSIRRIKDTIESFSPDIIHAHYGLCGIIANTQRRVPVVTTFHGTDLNNTWLRLISSFAILLSKASIVVSSALRSRALFHHNLHVIPCGVDTQLMIPMKKEEARIKLGWDLENKIILFSKEFHNKAKNYPLAKASIDLYNERLANGQEIKLLEFIGYSREQVLWLYNAVDCVLMTSNYEGSPQFIKEAMACDSPVVSVDVGDVKEVISGTDGCYIAERSPEDIASKLDLAIHFGRTKGRNRILRYYSSETVARRILDIYRDIIGHE